MILILYIAIFLSLELFDVLELFKTFQEMTPALGSSQQKESSELGVLPTQIDQYVCF